MAGEKKQETRIIVKRKRGGSGNAHGSSSWKVAFADFMTAMMIVFLALWLLGLDDETRDGIESYFVDPFGQPGVPAGAIIPSPMTTPGGTVSPIPLLADRQAQRESFEEVAQAIEEALLNNDFEGARDFVDIRITDEGLVIELIDNEESFFFESGSEVVKPMAQVLFQVIADEMSRLPNPIVFEGHTDAVPFRNDVAYGNWELSAGRANAVRRVMQERAIRSEQIAEVRGYGANHLRRPEAPAHYSNRRVSVLARYLTP